MPYQFLHYRFDKGQLTSPSPKPATLFAPFLPEEYRCCLEGKDPCGLDVTVIAVGLMRNHVPIGVAVASYLPAKRQFDIHNLSISPYYRTPDVGAELLADIEEEGQKLGAQIFYLTFPAKAPFYDAILKAREWRGTFPFMVTCYYYMPAAKMPWIYGRYGHLEGVEEFPWTELTPQEKKQIIRDYDNQLFEYQVFPFQEEEKIEPINSLGIRYQGRVVAWMVTHRVDQDTIKYKALYVEKGLEELKLGPKLVAHAIIKHFESKVLWSVFEIPLLHVPSTWKRFVERRLVPEAHLVERHRLAWKEILG